MQHSIKGAFDVNEVSHIVVDEMKMSIAREMGDVSSVSGDQVVNADDLMAFGEEAIAKMRAEKTRRSSDQYSQRAPSLDSSTLRGSVPYGRVGWLYLNFALTCLFKSFDLRGKFPLKNLMSNRGAGRKINCAQRL